jgi:hypothetical protein
VGEDLPLENGAVLHLRVRSANKAGLIVTHIMVVSAVIAVIDDS